MHVADIIQAGKSGKRIKEALDAKFDIKDMGKLHYFLEIKFLQDKKTGNVSIGQPADVESIRTKEVWNGKFKAMQLTKATDDEQNIDQQLYQSAIRSLLYLSGGTRPDITFSVRNLAKFSAKPSKKHWTAIKHVMRYLKGTIKQLILAYYTPSKNQKILLPIQMQTGLEILMTANQHHIF